MIETENSKIRVARATRDNIEIIARWQVAMAQESESMSLDLSTVLQGVTRVFDDPQIGYYLLAMEDNTAIGCCLVLREWSDWRNGDVLWIHSVYTLPAHRRKGVFKSLYRFLATEVKASKNIRGLRLYVDRGNTVARKTYESLGMNRDHYDLYEWMKT